MEIADEPNAAMLMTQLQPNNTLLDIREQQNTSTSTTPADEDDSGSQPTSLNNHEESFAGCQEESSALQGAEPSSVTYRDTTTGGSSLGDDYVVSGQAGSFLGQSSGSDGPATKSNFRGVSFDKKKRKWRVQIKVCGGSRWIGWCWCGMTWYTVPGDTRVIAHVPTPLCGVTGGQSGQVGCVCGLL